MPSSPSNTHSSLPLHSHPFISYHLLTPYISSLSLAQLFLCFSFLMMTTHCFFYAPLSVSLLFSHLPFPHSLPVLSSFFYFSRLFSPRHAGRQQAPRPAAYPPYSLESADYFSGGRPVCALHHSVISSSSSELERIRMGRAFCLMLWLVANSWPKGMSTSIDTVR